MLDISSPAGQIIWSIAITFGTIAWTLGILFTIEAVKNIVKDRR